MSEIWANNPSKSRKYFNEKSKSQTFKHGKSKVKIVYLDALKT